METIPPHDITGRGVFDYLPQGEGAERLITLMRRAREVLHDHPVNKARVKEGKKPANSVWLWGQGRAPNLAPVTARYNIKGGMISAVDLLNGIGIYAGLDIIKVAGATGYTDTNYIGKARKALESLKELDFVFLHVEAPDEMGHEGNMKGKIKAIEDFDEKIVGVILDGIKNFDAFRVMVLSDHPTPLSMMTHSSDPTPFAVFSSQQNENMFHGCSFGETSARKGAILVSPGHMLMDLFIRGWKRFVDEKSH
jgi:2,3-bisphosphoglycerate-independent phosphoglycerate mutase